jgi:hypothetical protein
VISNLNVNVASAVSRDYAAAWFDLRPGLYPIAWAFGCWHNNEVAGPGRMTILISRPGDNTLLPAGPGDFVR